MQTLLTNVAECCLFLGTERSRCRKQLKLVYQNVIGIHEEVMMITLTCLHGRCRLVPACQATVVSCCLAAAAANNILTALITTCTTSICHIMQFLQLHFTEPQHVSVKARPVCLQSFQCGMFTYCCIINVEHVCLICSLFLALHFKSKLYLFCLRFYSTSISSKFSIVVRLLCVNDWLNLFV